MGKVGLALARVAAVLVLVVCLSGCDSPVRTRLATDGRVDNVLGRGAADAQVVIEPDQGWRPLVRAIDRAQNRIFVVAYILTDSRVVHALERASAQGVDVYVMLEPHPLGMGPQPARMADSLRAAGIAVRWTRPGFLLTHAKVMVLDDSLAIVSTANFSRSAFHQNRDFLVYDREPRDVRQISNLFRTDWDRLPASFNAPNLMLSPDNARPKLLALLASARTTVDIDDEEVADPGVERALTRLARRGVAVRLLMPWGASLPAASVLLRGHVAVRELRSPYVHAKLVCVDRTEAYAGSENFSTASLDRNRELGILLRGPVVARLERVFAADWRRAAPPPLR